MFTYFFPVIFARCVGETFVQIFFCVLPLYMIVAIFIDDYNLCDEQMIYGIISIILAYGIRFLYSLSIGLLAFWLIVTWPLNMFLGAIYKLLSGMWIPVSLFPDLLSRINCLLPFQAIYGIPVTILTSPMETYRIQRNLFLQLLWIIILFGITEEIWKLGRRKIVVQGG